MKSYNKAKGILAVTTFSTVMLTGCSHDTSQTQATSNNSAANMALTKKSSKAKNDNSSTTKKLSTYETVPTIDVLHPLGDADKITLPDGSQVQIGIDESYVNSQNGVISLNPIDPVLKDAIVGNDITQTVVVPKDTTILPYAFNLTTFVNGNVPPTKVTTKPLQDDESILHVYLVTKNHTVDLSANAGLGNGAIVIPNDEVNSAKFKIVYGNKTTYVNLLGKKIH